MPLFLTILEGPTAPEARPIMAIHDPHILAAVRALMHDRLTDHGSHTPQDATRTKGALRLAPKGEADAAE